MNKNKILIAFVAVLSFFSPIINAQDTEEDVGLWATVIAEGKFNDKFGWYAELQGRLKDDASRRDQAFFRPAINYWLSEKTSLWLGYVAAARYTPDDARYEKRYWQQLMHRFEPVAGFGLLSRTRFEQRDLDTTTDTAHRFRQMIRLEKQLFSSSPTQLLVQDEVFINLNNTKNGPQSGFEQNRLFLGAALFPTKTSRLEIGYLNQTVDGANVNNMNHILSSTLFLRF